MAAITANPSGLNKRVVGGVIGGVAGGVVFGMMMAMMGMLPMVAGLAGSASPVVGFIVHLVISVVIGVIFGLAVGSRVSSLQSGALWGLANGAVWWILGPIVIMPLMMGMGLQFGAMFTTPMLMSLVGHLLYGGVAGLVYAWWARRG
jgi:uncharacterized membrane protein YagU involved in acid resistance